MSLLSWLLESRSYLAEETQLARPAGWLIDFFGGGKSKAGVSVDASMVMTVAAFYRGLSIRTNSLAMLPLDVRKKRKRGSETADDHWSSLLFNEITPEHVNFAWFKLMEHNRILAGNAYALMVYNGAGEVVSMPPIHPSRIRAKRLSDGTLYYEIDKKDGGKDTLGSHEVFHIHGSYSEDGITSRPLVDMMRESVGVTLAMQEHGSRLFSNGARIGGILKHPTRFSSDEVAKRVRKSFEDANAGLGNAHRTALLEEGMDWVKVSLTAEEAQFLEGRKFEVTEAARWLELPPHMIADLEKSSFNNIEQQGQEFKTHTMQPAVTLWEQVLKRKLLTRAERKKYFFKFNMNALVRADLAARTAYYRAGREWGWLNADDVAELEDMNPLPDGKGQIYLQPMNYQEAGAPAQEPDAEPKAEEVKKRASQALQRIFDSEMSKICAKEANALRNLLKKSAKHGNLATFRAEFAEFVSDSGQFIEKILMPCARSWAELEQISEVAIESRLRRFAKKHAQRLQERLSEQSDTAAFFQSMQDACSLVESEAVILWESKEFSEVLSHEEQG